MYQDKEKSKKIYVESNCVSRDDCCWDETPDTSEVVAVNEQTEQWPNHWTEIQ